MIYTIIIFTYQLDYLDTYIKLTISINLNVKNNFFIEITFMIILDIYKNYTSNHIYNYIGALT